VLACREKTLETETPMYCRQFLREKQLPVLVENGGMSYAIKKQEGLDASFDSRIPTWSTRRFAMIQMHFCDSRIGVVVCFLGSRNICDVLMVANPRESKHPQFRHLSRYSNPCFHSILE